MVIPDAFCRWRAGQDRVIPVVQGGSFEKGLLGHTAGIVALPFAEMPFGFSGIRIDKSLDSYLGIGWYGEPGSLALDYRKSPVPDSAHIIKLTNMLRDLRSGDSKEQRINAKDHHGRARFAAIEIGITVNPAMMSVGDHHAHGVAVVQLASVSSHINLSGFEIPGYIGVSSANVPAAIQFMPGRHGGEI